MGDLRFSHSNAYFPISASTKQSIDTGMAFVLIFLLVSYFTKSDIFIIISICLLLFNMIYPNIYRPLSRVWFGISNILGSVVSRLIMTLIFFLFVTTIGIFRKVIRADSLQLKEWKRDNTSVFRVRDQAFQPEEIERPY
jgi:hypothetical protein